MKIGRLTQRETTRLPVPAIFRDKLAFWFQGGVTPGKAAEFHSRLTNL